MQTEVGQTEGLSIWFHFARTTIKSLSDTFRNTVANGDHGVPKEQLQYKPNWWPCPRGHGNPEDPTKADWQHQWAHICRALKASASTADVEANEEIITINNFSRGEHERERSVPYSPMLKTISSTDDDTIYCAWCWKDVSDEEVPEKKIHHQKKRHHGTPMTLDARPPRKKPCVSRARSSSDAKKHRTTRLRNAPGMRP